jgi:hypothetical protein
LHCRLYATQANGKLTAPVNSETCCRDDSAGGWPLVFLLSPQSATASQEYPQVWNTSTFKHEYHYRHGFATKAERVVAVDKWMHFYDDQSHHWVIGMLSPIAYQQLLNAVLSTFRRPHS